MKEADFVNKLFADYEDTAEIRDFKEEITVNFKERVRALISKGCGEEQAFKEAAAELGDITAIADEVGKKKRNETMGQMYMNAKTPMKKATAAGFTLATAVLGVAVVFTLVTLHGDLFGNIAYYFSALLVAVSVSIYIYFGLTRDTAAHYPVSKQRAKMYQLCGFAGLTGVGFMVVQIILKGFSVDVFFIMELLMILFAACFLLFLVITEPNRQKPWMKAMAERETERFMNFQMNMASPEKYARYGVLSGGLWILAIAVFVTLGFIIGWQYAWIVFLFAVAAQVFMTAMIFEKKN